MTRNFSCITFFALFVLFSLSVNAEEQRNIGWATALLPTINANSITEACNLSFRKFSEDAEWPEIYGCDTCSGWSPSSPSGSGTDGSCVMYCRANSCPANRYYHYTGFYKNNKKQPHELCVGDPIIVATGNSFQTEVDYQSNNSLGLRFIRFYNSAGYDIGTNIDGKWSHNHSYKVLVVETDVSITRSTGRAFVFNYDGNNWQGDVDIPDTLEEVLDGGGVRTGWVYTDSQDNVEAYDAEGQLLSITNRAGQSQTLAYDVTVANGGDDNDSTLDKVTSYTGEEMLFSYDSSQRISTMTDPEGNQYHYAYDAIGNLISVTYPDDTPSDLTNNPVRTYHYENTTFPHHLTGLTDETGSRVTWAFDTEGRAISSELDGGVDKVTLDYSVADQVTVTNPLGKDTTYHFTTLHDVKKVTQVEGHATSSCAGANQNYSYDANGYIQSKTDWQGNTTTYVHDTRGLETSRTEASGTADARTITTTWHPDFRLPTQIVEPGKVTTFTYDSQGRQSSRTTNDVP